MPYVDLSIATPTAAPQGALHAVRTGLTRLMADVLRKRADLTVVSARITPAGDLSIGGEPLASTAWSGRLIAYVTEGTNSDEEKARFLERAYQLLSEQLGAPASPFYIVVQEVPAGAWGFDGRSQADRARVPAPAA